MRSPQPLLNPLSANFTKWSNTLKEFVGKLPTNCLSVFDHFVGLALKGLKNTRALTSFTQRLFLSIPSLFASIMSKANVKGIQNSIFGRYCNNFHFKFYFCYLYKEDWILFSCLPIDWNLFKIIKHTTKKHYTDVVLVSFW